MKTHIVRLLILFIGAAGAARAQAPEGNQVFLSQCSACHGTDGNGGEHAPSIIARVQRSTEQELTDFLKTGALDRGMPSFSSMPPAEMNALLTYLRATVQALAQSRTKVTTTDGRTLEGTLLAQTGRDLQLRTDDQRIHLLRRTPDDRFREVTSQTDWPNFNGGFNGNRYSKVAQINQSNVGKLAPKWVFPVPNGGLLQGTPIVVEGVMYVPATNTVIALDAGSGARLWTFTRPPTQGLVGNARGLGNNRALAFSGDRLFMQMDNARLVALNRFTGKLLWETEMADWHQNYNGTGSVLAVENLVISGTAGGEEGVRGFLAAYDQETGKEVWRFWTIPDKGDPGSETWDGIDIVHGGGPTWLTGSYDPESKTLYWTTGNAGPDMNGDNRKGDNLFTCSILALDLNTGKLKWHFQTTPHDEWDWDAAQAVLLLDTTWHGQPRKLLVQANRNGFLYILDRTDGKMLQATPLVKRLTWAKEILPDGRPSMNPDKTPTTQGNLICPALVGATNFFSPSFNPVTGLLYLNTLESCAIFTRRASGPWVAGKGYAGGSERRVPDEKDQKFLRAFDIQTGKIVWEVPESGLGVSRTGVISTAGGVVFYGEDGGALSAADASTGKVLWSYPFTEVPRSSPMSYVFDNKQYVTITNGAQVYTFGLPE